MLMTSGVHRSAFATVTGDSIPSDCRLAITFRRGTPNFFATWVSGYFPSSASSRFVHFRAGRPFRALSIPIAIRLAATVELSRPIRRPISASVSFPSHPSCFLVHL